MILEVTTILKRNKDESSRHLLLLGGDLPVRADGASERQLVNRALVQEMSARDPALASLPEQEQVKRAESLIASEPLDSPLRRRLVLQALKEVQSTSGHVRLARLIRAGYFGSVVVFGANDLLEQALASERLTAETDYNLILTGRDSAQRASGALTQSLKATLIKVYGDVSRSLLPLTAEERSRALDQLAEVIGPISDCPLMLVNLSEEEEALLPKLQRQGGPVFWIHPKAPVYEQSRYEELKAGPEEEFLAHDFRPELMRFLTERNSTHNIATRTNGQFDYFIAHLHQRLLLPGLEKHISSLKGTRPAVLPDAPYKFLVPFETADESIFCGRDAEKQALVDLIKLHRLVVLVGAPGVGKTSLIQAGCVPVLESEEQEEAEAEQQPWFTVVTRPLLIRTVPERVLSRLDGEQADAVRPYADKPLAEFLVQVSATTGRKILLAVDTWEEVWAQLPAEDREATVQCLAQCATGEDTPVHVLLSVRSDFLAHLCDLRERLPGIFDAPFHLKRLTRSQARIAIARPARKFHLVVEGALVEQLLDALYADGVDPSELELVCYQLLNSLSPTEHFISQTKYSATGGVRAILDGFLDDAIRRLPWRDRPAAIRVLREMVGPQQERLVVTRERLLEATGSRPRILDRLLWQLTDAGLIRSLVPDSTDQLELTHDLVTRAVAQTIPAKEQRPKQVQALLARALRAYQEHGALMSVDEMRAAEDAAQDLELTAEEWEMIARSCLALDRPLEPWLSQMSNLNERQLPLLAELLGYQSKEVRRKALAEAERLARAGLSRQLLALLPQVPPDSRRELEELLQHTDRELTQALRTGDAEARKQTVTDLARLGSEQAARSLVTALEDQDAGVRHAAAKALGSVGDQRTLPALMRRLEEGTPEARWEIARTLASIASRLPVSTIVGKIGGAGRGPLSSLSTLVPSPLQPLLGGIAGRPWAQMISSYAVGLALAQRRNVVAAREWLERASAACREEADRQVVAQALVELGRVEARLREGYYLWPCFHKDPAHSGCSPEEAKPPLQEQWAVKLKGQVSCAPVAAWGGAFAVSRAGEMVALDVRSGSQLWKTNVPKTEASPALSGDRLYLGCENGAFLCLSAEDGRVLWQQQQDTFRASPVVGDDIVVAASWTGEVYCWETKAGRQRWRRQAAGQVLGCPALGSDFVVVGDWKGDLTCLGLDDGRERWRFQAGGEIHGSAALADDSVIIATDDGSAYRVAAEDGRLLWQTAIGSRLRASPAVAADRVILGSGDGSLCAAAIADGSLLWRTKAEEEIFSSPAIAHDIVYYASRDGSLRAASLATGEMLWQMQTSYAVLGSPAVVEGVVVVPLRYSEICGLAPAAPAEESP
jgi:outer membrane protein assembly factor BamB/HEAT repeat protein